MRGAEETSPCHLVLPVKEIRLGFTVILTEIAKRVWLRPSWPGRPAPGVASAMLLVRPVLRARDASSQAHQTNPSGACRRVVSCSRIFSALVLRRLEPPEPEPTTAERDDPPGSVKGASTSEDRTRHPPHR